MALPPCLLVCHPWATMMVQQQTTHAQLAAATQAQAQVQAALAAAQPAHLQALVHEVHHHPPHAATTQATQDHH